ncbi:hypothetical protein [Bradyrhizobium sp. AUGA SZCCT0176]|uniref:hypothetical protein n=1 Tax=Bradyrhizobium sp. AUGA SZCCT0176 TaxID=2807664 RepID=UPI001BA82A9C|nr:hypothetical protein [Bradyrhizobium sp. AUGA SZCCT0176]
MQPAKSILDRIGVDKAAAITGKSLSRVYRWAKPASRGGTGGVIPHADALKLLDHCRAEGIPVTEADFMRAPALAKPEQRGVA